MLPVCTVRMPAGGRAGSSEFGVQNKREGDSELKGDFVEITFADTGKGMSEEVKKRIFDPFFTTRRPQGIGLGMSVVHSVIARHDGKVEVESEVGRGTTVTLSIPIRKENAQQKVS